MNDYNPIQTPLPKGFKIGKKKKHLNQLLLLLSLNSKKLIYLMNTHPYILFIVNIISRYMNALWKIHFEIVKHCQDTLQELMILEFFMKHEI